MRMIPAHIENGDIILDQKIELPNGLKVQVLLPLIQQPTGTGLCGIWEDKRTAEEIVQEILSSRTMGRTDEVLD